MQVSVKYEKNNEWTQILEKSNIERLSPYL